MELATNMELTYRKDIEEQRVRAVRTPPHLTPSPSVPPQQKGMPVSRLPLTLAAAPCCCCLLHQEAVEAELKRLQLSSNVSAEQARHRVRTPGFCPPPPFPLHSTFLPPPLTRTHASDRPCPF